MVKRKHKQTKHTGTLLLKIWLWVLLIGNGLYVILSLFNQLIVDPIFYIPAILAMSKVIFVVALFNWKKWGFYGFCIASVLAVINNVYYYTDWFVVISPILNVIILYFVMKSNWKNFR